MGGTLFFLPKILLSKIVILFYISKGGNVKLILKEKRQIIISYSNIILNFFLSFFFEYSENTQKSQLSRQSFENIYIKI